MTKTKTWTRLDPSNVDYNKSQMVQLQDTGKNRLEIRDLPDTQKEDKETQRIMQEIKYNGVLQVPIKHPQTDESKGKEQ